VPAKLLFIRLPPQLSGPFGQFIEAFGKRLISQIGLSLLIGCVEWRLPILEDIVLLC